MRSATISLQIGVAMLLGCSGPQEASYFPEPRINSTYQFTVDFTDELGQAHTGRMVKRYDGDTVVAGQRYIRVSVAVSGVPGLFSATSYQRQTSEGLYMLGGTPGASEILSMPFPIMPGKSWTTTNAGIQQSYKAEGPERVVLVSKTYDDCLKVSTKLLDVTSINYYCKGIGVVQSIITGGSGGPVTISLDSLSR